MCGCASSVKGRWLIEDSVALLHQTKAIAPPIVSSIPTCWKGSHLKSTLEIVAAGWHQPLDRQLGATVAAAAAAVAFAVAAPAS